MTRENPTARERQMARRVWACCLVNLIESHRPGDRRTPASLRAALADEGKRLAKRYERLSKGLWWESLKEGQQLRRVFDGHVVKVVEPWDGWSVIVKWDDDGIPRRTDLGVDDLLVWEVAE